MEPINKTDDEPKPSQEADTPTEEAKPQEEAKPKEDWTLPQGKIEFYILNDPIFRAALFAYEDAAYKFERMDGNLEATNYVAWESICANYHTSREALAAVIDAFCTRIMAERLNPDQEPYDPGEWSM